MFFFLSKTLDLLATPIAWTLLLGLAGLLVSWRWPLRKVLARSLIGGGLFVLYVFSLAPICNRLQWMLEDDAASTYSPEATWDAVILLGGMVELLVTRHDGPISYNDSVERLHVTYELLRSGQAKVAILSGGTVVNDSLSEARALARQLRSWGIAEEQLIVEDQARNTHENAVFSKAIVEERGFKSVLLVTSAFHMTRSKECFNAVGLHVDTLPVDRRVYDSKRARLNLMPRAAYLEQSTSALRELLGRVVYRARGYAKAEEAGSL